MSTEMTHHMVECTGVKLHYVKKSPPRNGVEKPILVFLHGFPEFWKSWEQQLVYFGERVTAIAPDLPGYNLSDKPVEEDFYRIPNLIEVIAAFLRTVSPDRPVTLVAHDWGGVIAWPLAAFHPHLIERLVIINAAHPSTLTRELDRNPRQREKSRYIYDLISPDGIQRVSENDYQYLRQMLFGTMAGDPLPESRKTDYLQAWARPGAIEAMLNYYRAMPQVGNGEDGRGKAAEMRIPDVQITVPTLVLWGQNDPAFVPEVLEGLDYYVSDLKVVHYPSQTHWLHHEQPVNVNKEIEGFLAHKRG